MPFGIKNVGATYQRMVTRMFRLQIWKTVEMYIDDMVIKSKVSGDHLLDLAKVSGILRRHKLRLNASKCVFGVDSGQFLGFLITCWGIEVNPWPNKRNLTPQLFDKYQGSLKAHEHDSGAKLIRVQVGWQVSSFLPVAKEMEEFSLDGGVWQCLLEFKALSCQSPNPF